MSDNLMNNDELSFFVGAALIFLVFVMFGFYYKTEHAINSGDNNKVSNIYNTGNTNETNSREQPQECTCNCTFYYKCDITAYSGEVRQTNSNPAKTALMEEPRAGGTCAVSRDLKKYLGMWVYISGVGVFRVNDLMNERYEKRIDIFLGSKEEAVDFGLKENVEVVFFRKERNK